MPPGRPPKRSGPSHQLTQDPPPPTSNPGPSTTADSASATHHSGQASSPSHPSISFVSADDDHHRLTPLLNTTFSTHRLSPLHIGSHPLTQDRLHTLSRRLRDFLVGDVVRGVAVGLDRSADDGTMVRAGVLEAVAIAWVTLDSLVGPCAAQQLQLDGWECDPTPASGDSENLGDDQAGDVSGLSTSTSVGASSGKRRALQILLQYEHAECAALLLPSTTGPTISEDAAAAIDRAASASHGLFNFANRRSYESDTDFLHLPLLLLRMPAPLKAAIIGFLSRTFDCRISALSLGTRNLVQALETWTGELGLQTDLRLAKDVVLTLGFYSPTVMRPQRRWQQQQNQQDVTQNKETEEKGDDASEASGTAMGIKSIDIIIPSPDLRRFISAGQGYEVGNDEPLSRAQYERKRAGTGARDLYGETKRRKLGGDKDEEGWAWRQCPAASKPSYSSFGPGPPQPFIEALAQYVQQHLALDMFHPAVRISKIACGGFVLSEGRVKIFGVPPGTEGDRTISDTNQRATWGILEGLIEKARVNPPEETLRMMPV
ncbi:hypothetical protein Daus18300_011141 [Diaporthe australafricana]|uniref:F-box domain-containing protein n=1 Tax=Diaporthe australafricana TaxID=127596 RepID=A0ABR3W7V6_9PEZI